MRATRFPLLQIYIGRRTVRVCGKRGFKHTHNMSIPVSGVLGRKVGLAAAVAKQLRQVTLKPAKRITVTFDPFHEAAVNCRSFIFNISCSKVLGTNTNCLVKTEIVCDRREPTVSCILNPEIADKVGHKVVNFKAGQLTCLELLQLYNKYITPLAPKEDDKVGVVTKKYNKLKKGGRK